MFYKKSIKRIFFLFIFGIISILFISNVNAKINIEIDPEKPKPKETITLKAQITDVENLENMFIILDECGNEPGIGYVCYTDSFNVSMVETSADNYTATITLRHENAIEIKYQIRYLSSYGWNSKPEGNDLIKVDLDTSNQSNDNENQNTDTKTPGFQIFVLILAISIMLALYKKRLK